MGLDSDLMNEEAMSEAYTASEEYWHTEEATGRGAIRVAIQTYLAALPKGEPVAWQRRHPTEGWVFVRPDDIDHYRAQGQDIRPLFVTHPAGE